MCILVPSPRMQLLSLFRSSDIPVIDTRSSDASPLLVGHRPRQGQRRACSSLQKIHSHWNFRDLWQGLL
ncbi:unnamed protein product [Peronospora belbahrii]|uniref:Uncharacterized protein n=1 Tax=Peronospora belbahrii TaxID=622444 RepID=A0ABN8D5V6_9STRA|nr:unnamed protein product [Peronospora belbahrii]